MSEKVVQLQTVAPVSPTDADAFRQWAHEWIDGIFDHATPHTLVILVESADGTLSKVSQCVQRLDTARLVGLLTIAAQRAADGELPVP